MKTIKLICLLLLAVGSQAQNIILDPITAQEEYPFLYTEKNEIHFAENHNYTALFKRFDSLLLLNKGSIEILHFGGSHVQAGMLTNKLRENFLSLSPNAQAARGWLFPYKLAHTNNPINYKVSYTGEWKGFRNSIRKYQSDWGVSGVTAETYSTHASFTIESHRMDEAHYFFDKVRVYYQQNEASFVPVTDSLHLISVTKGEGYIEFSFDTLQDTLRVYLTQENSLQKKFLLQGIQFLSNDNGIVYSSFGVNGASVPSYLRCPDLPKQMKMMHPDLVIMGIGINDANVPKSRFSKEQYIANYDTLIASILAVNPDACFLFLTNNDSYYYKRYANPNIYKQQEAMYELAQKYNGAVWDLFEVMGGFNSIKTWNKFGLARRDKIHFSKPGYQLQADLMYYAFLDAYAQYLQHHNVAQK